MRQPLFYLLTLKSRLHTTMPASFKAVNRYSKRNIRLNGTVTTSKIL